MKKRHIFGIILLVLLIFGVILYFGFRNVPTWPTGGAFNTNGNVLITDQYNNRVIEVNPDNNQIVWSFGSNNPNLCNPGPDSIIGPNYAERLPNGLTIIAGTGIPPNSPDTAMPNGCADNRVIIVNQSGDIIWQYGQANVTGSDSNELNVPVSAIQLPNGNYLITDQGNNRVIEVYSNKSIVWSYGALNNPNSAELLSNGDILITDQNNNGTIEVNPQGKIVWEYYNNSISGAAFASRLANGDTLITDEGNARIFEINSLNQTVFQYFTNTADNSNPNPTPTNAVRFGNGNIMISDQLNHRVFAINSQNQIIWQYGMINLSGNGQNQLNGPYTAFVIGDYTGQTAPY